MRNITLFLAIVIASFSTLTVASPASEKPVILNQKLAGGLGLRYQVDIGHLRKAGLPGRRTE
jgi:hypothetical protein